ANGCDKSATAPARCQASRIRCRRESPSCTPSEARAPGSEPRTKPVRPRAQTMRFACATRYPPPHENAKLAKTAKNQISLCELCGLCVLAAYEMWSVDRMAEVGLPQILWKTCQKHPVTEPLRSRLRKFLAKCTSLGRG